MLAEHLETQFMINAEPYDEDTIIKVHRYLNLNSFDQPFDPATLTTPREVQSVVKKLHNRRAGGPDKISPLALKHIPRKLLVLITKPSFNIVSFPPQWKLARIASLPKPGKDLLYPQNYRQISLLCTISKAFERLIHTRPSTYVQEHNLIPNHQFGFRAKHDTTAQLVRVVE